MSMLEKLRENRTPILLAEIGAYLHLIGRFSKEFIESQAQDASVPFNYQNICNDSNFFENTQLNQILQDNIWRKLINNFVNLINAGELSTNPVSNFCNFIKKHTWRDNPRGLCKILADAHGIVSGIDKALTGIGKSGKQREKYTFRATAFGHEKRIKLMEKPGLKKELCQKIKEILEDIKNSQDVSYETYSKFIFIIREYYPKTIGETRRPINEISLYDYAHTIASLTKSNLAKMIIDGWYDPKRNSRWRILTINIDILGLLSKGLKIGDIMGYTRDLEKIFDEIKKIIEYESPLGNEIYRDSTGIYFSCPDVENVNSLKSEIEEKLKSINNLDFSLQVEITDKSRSMVILSREREEALKRIQFSHTGNVENVLKTFKESLNQGEDICPVCCIRLKMEKKDRCKRCAERYQRRGEKWIEFPKETIWLDEVADKNDRVALIVGKFDLEKWLSGEFIGTLASQIFDDWHTENSQICQNLGINTVDDLKNQFIKMFNNPSTLSNVQKELCRSFIGIRPNDFINDFWSPMAERDATGKALGLQNDSEKAEWLVRLLFRKHPSFARIYRVWKATQEFINEIVFEKTIKEHLGNSELRTQRVQFKIEPNPKIPEGSTCDIEIEGVRFSPVCIDKGKGIFVSTINIQILETFGKRAKEIADLKEIADFIDKKNIKIKYEGRNWEDARIVESQPAEDKFQNYLPHVKIYDFPDQFMVLVPAYEALDIAENILSEYEVQFSKVRDRLPFHLGVIAFHRRTPLYVVMDAGRRLLEEFKRKTQSKNAKVINIESLDKSIELEIETRDYSPTPFKWKVSYSTGDPDVEDLWHPYIRFNSNPGRMFSFDYTGKGDFVVHVKEIRPNDEIKIEPSYFTLTYLEDAVDRFRIGNALRPLHDITQLQKLFRKIEDRLKSRTWSMSQIYAFWEDVRKRQDYGENNFEKFVKSDLINILKIYPQTDKKDKEMFEEFLQGAKDGLLDLCLHWNFQIRKVKPTKEGEK